MSNTFNPLMEEARRLAGLTSSVPSPGITPTIARPGKVQEDREEILFEASNVIGRSQTYIWGAEGKANGPYTIGSRMQVWADFGMRDPMVKEPGTPAQREAFAASQAAFHALRDLEQAGDLDPYRGITGNAPAPLVASLARRAKVAAEAGVRKGARGRQLHSMVADAVDKELRKLAPKYAQSEDVDPVDAFLGLVELDLIEGEDADNFLCAAEKEGGLAESAHDRSLLEGLKRKKRAKSLRKRLTKGAKKALGGLAKAALRKAGERFKEPIIQFREGKELDALLAPFEVAEGRGDRLPVFVKVPKGKFVMRLSATVNPDHSPTQWNNQPIQPTYELVKDLADAARKARRFVDSNDLGGGNWDGGQIYNDKGRRVARVSYNGRAWDLKDKPLNKLPEATETNGDELAEDIREAEAEIKALDKVIGPGRRNGLKLYLKKGLHDVAREIAKVGWKRKKRGATPGVTIFSKKKMIGYLRFAPRALKGYVTEFEIAHPRMESADLPELNTMLEAVVFSDPTHIKGWLSPQSISRETFEKTKSLKAFRNWLNQFNNARWIKRGPVKGGITQAHVFQATPTVAQAVAKAGFDVAPMAQSDKGATGEPGPITWLAARPRGLKVLESTMAGMDSMLEAYQAALPGMAKAMKRKLKVGMTTKLREKRNVLKLGGTKARITRLEKLGAPRQMDDGKMLVGYAHVELVNPRPPYEDSEEWTAFVDMQGNLWVHEPA